MEQFVKTLYDRLETNRELQTQLLVIMDNAINEMHNNGIIAGLTGEAAQLVHDPNPEVRVNEKTCLAKAVGKQFISSTRPISSNGELSYVANVNYDSRFVNSITLCFQGEIEGLHTLSENNSNIRLDQYIIQIISGGKNRDAFKANIAQLDKMYHDISIVLMSGKKIIYGPGINTTDDSAVSGPTAAKKQQETGFLRKLLKRLSSADCFHK